MPGCWRPSSPSCAAPGCRIDGARGEADSPAGPTSRQERVLNKAFSYHLRGWTFYLYFRADANAEARRMYREAIREDGRFARAHADLAYSLLHAWLFNWDPAVTMDQARRHAEAALEIDRN